MTGATVIVYHGVEDCPSGSDPYRMLMPSSRFSRQLEFLARHRTVVSLDELLRGAPGANRPAVAITFDDGYANVLRVAAPMLAEHNFTATMFVPTVWLGRNKVWDPLDEESWPLPIMSGAQLRELEALGHRVESHGHQHARLDEMDYAAALADLTTSAQILQRELGRKPAYVAYPFGARSAETEAAAQAAGFQGAFSIGRPGTGRFDLARVTIRPTDGRMLFAYKTSGRYLSSRSAPLVAPGYRLAHPLLRWVRQHRRVTT